MSFSSSRGWTEISVYRKHGGGPRTEIRYAVVHDFFVITFLFFFFYSAAYATRDFLSQTPPPCPSARFRAASLWRRFLTAKTGRGSLGANKGRPPRDYYDEPCFSRNQPRDFQSVCFIYTYNSVYIRVKLTMYGEKKDFLKKTAVILFVDTRRSRYDSRCRHEIIFRG